MTIQYGQFESRIDAELTRELENGTDIRITESGDTRITNDAYLNVAISYLTATGNRINPLRDAYVKFSGIWRSTEPYVKHEGTWKEPYAIYVKQSGAWRRVY